MKVSSQQGSKRISTEGFPAIDDVDIELTGANEVEKKEGRRRGQSMPVIYDVNSTPPLHICFFLGLQVSLDAKLRGTISSLMVEGLFIIYYAYHVF